MKTTSNRNLFGVAAGVLTLVLVAGATLVIVGGGGASTVKVPEQIGCRIPPLSGSVIQVGLEDSATGPPAGMPARGDSMGITIQPGGVPAGKVSFEVKNEGGVLHELLVFPLKGSTIAGQRAVGFTGAVDEAGSLGEVETGCGTGAGSGIEPGAVGWLTLTLKPGRYELLCNFAGHYQMGMYGTLTVTG